MPTPWTWTISRLLGGIGALTPVLKTAIAYPLSTRFRTGMAMLLFAMVISTVTHHGVVIDATQTLVTPDSERNAGFEIGIVLAAQLLRSAGRSGGRDRGQPRFPGRGGGRGWRR